MSWNEGNRRLVEAVREALAQRLSGEQAGAGESVQAMGDFAERFFHNLAPEDLAGRDVSDLAGAIAGFWGFIQRFPNSGTKVRVFNPEYNRHGWESGHTVVAVLCRDMPFALESVRSELNRRNLAIHIVHSLPFRARRDDDQRLLRLLPEDAVEGAMEGAMEGAGESPDSSAEAMLYFEINRTSAAGELKELRRALEDVLHEVRAVTDDFDAMLERLEQAVADIDRAACDPDEADEARYFLRWMREGHFTFLGYEYLSVSGADAEPQVRRESDCDLGVLRLRSSFGQYELFRQVSEAPSLEVLAFAKSSVRSRVQRRVYPDYIEVRVFDGMRLVGQHRFMGMYTSRAYTVATSDIPVVRRKVAAVMRRSRLDPLSHEGSALARVLEVFPRNELFLASEDELFRIAMGINQIQERRQVRLFTRCDQRSKFVSCLVFMPRDLYRTELRLRIQDRLCEAYEAAESEFTTFFSESILTRTHFVLRVDPARAAAVDSQELEREVADLCMSWEDHLRRHLLEEFGEERGLVLADAYRDAFPAGYRDDCEPRAALHDIRKMAGLAGSRDISMSLYRAAADPANGLRFRLYHLDTPLVLSSVMPILENLGLVVLGERPYEISRRDGKRVWIHEFELRYPLREEVDVALLAESFQEAFARIWEGEGESDRFNQLVLGVPLSWREVALLRAYSRYLRLVQFPFSAEYIADTLARYSDLARELVELFRLHFDPDLALDWEQRRQRCAAQADVILGALDAVPNLAEDRILRMYLTLIQATLRSNYFCFDADLPRSEFSFKLRPAAIPDLPLPLPEYEIFVYSPRVEGVHLRGAQVARGGLRWSDRLEDYRTEILGLLKAQQVKNAVIVPAGAKGGFIARRAVADSERGAEGRACYRLFIRALLDVTDNLVADQVAAPERVLRWDGDDPYLVVAADKGTATFSDLANEVAAEYGFWLGDAFASGGRYGYDHKRMGITARGAWVSVQRHFREVGVDVQRSPISAVGIGDMNGDVFGNGMLCSEQIRLLAAFNHQHIFLDPDPNPTASYRERQRLFELPRSSWEDYDAGLISAGGGVYSRDAKSIPITPEVQAVLDIEAEQLSPNALINAILKAPVDLLWNGGIGTYVKAAGESHAEVGDKANDALRVDGGELRCRAVGEGGNLGMTQLGRVEYALRGGRCNTDFIDNSGGVDCSDHEVNLKIVLKRLVDEGEITEKQRRELLEEFTDEVAQLVLVDNQRQTLALSLAERDAVARSSELRRLIVRLENEAGLDRAQEALPDDEQLAERRARGEGLTRPELALLLCTVKSHLKTVLTSSTVMEGEYLGRALTEAFPAAVPERFGNAVAAHRLRREIVATQVANAMINDMGITFVDRMQQSTGAGIGIIACAYVAARDLFDLPRHWAIITDLEGQIDSAVLHEMLAVLIRLVRRGARWLIRNRRGHLDPGAEVALFRDALVELAADLPGRLPQLPAEDFRSRREALLQAGVPAEPAQTVALASALYPGLGIIDAAWTLGQPTGRVAEAFFSVAAELELDWFTRCIAELKVENHWQALARESYRDDLEWQLRTITEAVLQHSGDGPVQAGLEAWMQRQQRLVARWRAMLADLHATETPEPSMYAVALRELLDLAQSSRFEEGHGQR